MCEGAEGAPSEMGHGPHEVLSAILALRGRDRRAISRDYGPRTKRRSRRDVSHHRLLRLEHVAAFASVRDLQNVTLAGVVCDQEVLIPLARQWLRGGADAEHVACDARSVGGLEAGSISDHGPNIRSRTPVALAGESPVHDAP